ncbi:MAG: hemerythrin domain-containing protein [Dehalococcoidia bacterium]|nr:hemerythrin domain-containing protein [Dehalococcoidia bacterium]
MENYDSDSEILIREHKVFNERMGRLKNIASELDEISSTYAVQQLTSQIEKNPLELLAQLADVLQLFGEGLRSHFVKEEKFFPDLASRFGGAETVSALLEEHKQVLKVVQELNGRAVALAASGAAASGDSKDELNDIISSLRNLLVTLSSHAEKEDEVLFITGHNA